MISSDERLHPRHHVRHVVFHLLHHDQSRQVAHVGTLAISLRPHLLAQMGMGMAVLPTPRGGGALPLIGILYMCRQKGCLFSLIWY